MISKLLEVVRMLFGLWWKILAWHSAKLKYYLSAHSGFKSIKYHYLNSLNLYFSLLLF